MKDRLKTLFRVGDWCNFVEMNALVRVHSQICSSMEIVSWSVKHGKHCALIRNTEQNVTLFNGKDKLQNIFPKWLSEGN